MSTYKDSLIFVSTLSREHRLALAAELSLTPFKPGLMEPTDRDLAQRLCELFQLSRSLRQVSRW